MQELSAVGLPLRPIKQEELQIGEVPAVIYGDPSDRIYLFIHGQFGHKEEAGRFAEIAAAAGWQVLSIDLPEHGARKGETGRFLPWIIVPELLQIWDFMASRWRRIALRANSIGAWFSLLAFADKKIARSLFVSPILDMEHLISQMMASAGVTEAQLAAEKEIALPSGPILSWTYWLYARQHPVARWDSDTRILYGSLDQMTGRQVVDRFVSRFAGQLTVMENGEHWFHTEAQLAVLGRWEEEHVTE